MDPPKNLAEVEKLVQKLYLPGSSLEVNRIQDILQKIQRSSEGWRLANALLESVDEKVRFFGALTFTIKINQDWDSLSSLDAVSLQDKLLSWLIRLVSIGEKPLVLRKICTSLVAYFLRPSVAWKHCIRHLICCFSTGDVVPCQFMSQDPVTSTLVSKLHQLQLVTVLWFCVGLVEEVGKTNSASLQTHDLHIRVIAELDDVVVLIKHTLELRITGDIKAAVEGIKCFQSWVLYTQRIWIQEALKLDPLRQLTPFALCGLTIEGLFDVTAELFTDILMHFPAFLTADDYLSLTATLSGPMGQNHTNTLKTGDFSVDSMTFAKLLFAYGDAAIQDLAKNFALPQYVTILGFLTELLVCDAYAGAEDEVCSQCLEFWTTFTEFLVDSVFAVDNEVPEWMRNARNYIPRVIQACWIKIRMPPQDIFITWDSVARERFKDFRADVKDLLQSSYTILSTNIIDEFAKLALESLSNHAWLHLEATLFCLNAFSDSVSHENSADELLSSLFGSSLFSDMVNSPEIPAMTKQTAVYLVISYTSFFERHPDYLPSMLSFLFTSLKAPAISNVAAKAIHSSTLACRKALVPELMTFFRQYEILLGCEGIEASTKEKIMGAVAAIIQALPSEEEKLKFLDTLLDFVDADVRTYTKLLREDRLEEAQNSGLCALRCLVSMGKSFQAPDDVIIDLDANNDPTALWPEWNLTTTQSRIINIIDGVTSLMRSDSQVIEAACQILRTGYKESVPGPFVFPPSVTENFVTSSNLNTARLDYVLDTAGALLSRHRRNRSAILDNAALTFLNHILNLINAMGGNPSTDPEVASSCVDLADKLIPNHLHLFMNVNIQIVLPALFTFALQCVTAAEAMTKRSGSNFWASLVQVYDLSDEMQSLMRVIMEEYGPPLCYALIANIGGGAARSDLDILAEPLKKMVQAQPKVKMWLADALSSQHFSSEVTDTEKRIWLQKIISLRGGKGTNQVIKEFWMACRGTNLSFIS